MLDCLTQLIELEKKRTIDNNKTKNDLICFEILHYYLLNSPKYI